MHSLYIHLARQYPTMEPTASDSTFESAVSDSIQPQNQQHPAAHSNLKHPTVSNHTKGPKASPKSPFPDSTYLLADWGLVILHKSVTVGLHPTLCGVCGQLDHGTVHDLTVQFPAPAIMVGSSLSGLRGNYKERYTQSHLLPITPRLLFRRHLHFPVHCEGFELGARGKASQGFCLLGLISLDQTDYGAWTETTRQLRPAAGNQRLRMS